MLEFLKQLLDTSDFPARWHCGNWSEPHGWLHIISDLGIFSAYMAIPILMLAVARKHRGLPYIRLFLLFAGFIVFCGLTHLNEAIIFWVPVYRWAGVVKFATAVISWVTVIALFRALPKIWAEGVRVTDELEQHSDNLSLILETVNDGYWDWDVENNEEFLSPKFKDLFGYADHELPNSPETWQRLIHPDDLPVALANAKQHMDDPNYPYHQEVRYRHKNGRWVWVVCRGVGIRDAKGKCYRIVGTHVDVTRHKETEEQLRTVNGELKQFVYAASHDLREPLRVLNGYAHLIKPKLNQFDDTTREYVGHMVAATGRMSAMLDSLLFSSRIQRNDDPFVELDTSKIAMGAGHNLGLETETLKLEELLPIRGHEGMLTRLFQNLFQNAIKFRQPDVEPEITVMSKAVDNNLVQITVSDNGIGIAERHLEAVFNLFRQLHPSGDYEGTGAGLALCKQIVERHGGSIWATSKIGEGSQFHFTLPGADS